MKKWIIMFALLPFVLAACNKQNTQGLGNTSDIDSDTTPEATETSVITNEDELLSHDEAKYLDTDLFPILDEEDVNYKLYTDSHNGGYYYEIYDNQGVLIDSGFTSWRLNKLEYVGDSLLTLQTNAGNAMFNAKYYDVEKGRVSRFFSKPAGNSDRFIAYFTSDDRGIKLVVCDLFDPDEFYIEFYDDSFTTGVYTAQCVAEFSDDEHSVTVSYFSSGTGEKITKTFSLE